MTPAQCLAGWLQRWRDAARLSQGEAARRAGIVQHQLSRLEHGGIARPSFQDVVSVIQVYGVAPNEVAQRCFGWQPPKTYESPDYRWEFVRDFLSKASDEAREKLLHDIYDRAMFYAEVEKAGSPS